MRRNRRVDIVNRAALLDLLDDAVALSSNYVALRVGIDRVENEAFAKLAESSGDDFLHEVFTSEEITYCSGQVERLAARFCAKEATLKVLGTGIRGVALAEVEVVHAANGQPDIALSGRASDRASALHVVSLAVSITHTKFAAEAVVVALLDDRMNELNIEGRNIDG
jgi:holo-[acyl-carrier protein] synthase